MVDLEKLSQTIEELDQETNRIKSVRLLLDEAYQIQTLQKENEEKYISLLEEMNYLEEMLNDNVDSYKDNLDKIEEKHNEVLEKYNEFKSDFFSSTTEYSRETRQLMDQRISEQNEIIMEQNKLIHSLINRQETLNEEIQKKVSIISSENTKLYLDSKDYLNAKLDVENNKLTSSVSTIFERNKNEIDKMDNKISDAIIQVENKMVDLDKKLEISNMEQGMKIKRLIFLITCAVVISIINIILSIFV